MMEVAIVSLESIKPFSQTCDLKPFNLCLLDQLTPTTYSPLILFYNTKDNATRVTAQLKSSLSKTLNSFYPLSGRVKDNLIIHDFNAGVPCFEARVKGHLSDFLRGPQMETLNRFLPSQPFCQLADPTVPQLLVQVNVFDCGGVALGMCFSHKINDGVTGSSFIKSWAANSSGSFDKVLQPNLFEASTVFPPQKSLPSRYLSLMESLWFSKRSFRTRRFVFDENAVADLVVKGRSESVRNPTRAEVLSAFIWKFGSRACKTTYNSPRPSVLSQAVNIRRLTKPRLSKYSIGNLVWSATARCGQGEREMEMKELVGLVREGVGAINSEFIERLSGSNGYETALKLLDKLEEISKGNPNVFSFSSWHTFGSSEMDFGWGKPISVGVFGEASRHSASDSNLIILKDIPRSNSLEAWITLEENTMDVLEHDPEFLAFACESH